MSSRRSTTTPAANIPGLAPKRPARVDYNRRSEARALRIVFNALPRDLLAAAATDLERLAPREGSPSAAVIAGYLASARATFEAAARPRGVLEEIDGDAFLEIYHGRGDNDERSPVPEVVESSQRLALFAVTVGEEPARRVTDLFAGDRLAEGYLLDQVASSAADALVSAAAARFAAAIASPDLAVLPYSPGYCGWAVTGQHALFARLAPEEIGITVNASGLMRPIKSVSGVLVGAPVDVHDFEPAFPCCAACQTMECRDRIERLRRSGAVIP